MSKAFSTIGQAHFLGQLLPLCLLVGFVISGCTPAAKPPEVSLDTLDPALGQTISQAQGRVRSEPRSGDAWGRLGQALEAAEFFSEARNCYSEAVRLDPTSARWFHLLGLLELQEHPEEAFEHLHRAAELAGSTNDAPRLRLAQALVERGRLSEAIPHLNALLKQDPYHPAARLELARIKFANKEYQSAAELLQSSLTNAYTAKAAHLLLSQAQHKVGNSDSAARLARRAAAMPRAFDWPDPFLREVQSLRADLQNLADRANSLLMQRRFDEAEKALEHMLAQDAMDSEALLLLGRLRIQQGRCNEAEEVLGQHLEGRPDSLHGLVQLGLAYFCNDRWNEAATAFQKALELKPDFAQAHYNLGVAFSRQNKPKLAINAYKEALRCQPGEAAAYAGIAEESLKTGETRQARVAAEQALRIDPKQPKALMVLQTLGNQSP